MRVKPMILATVIILLLPMTAIAQQPPNLARLSFSTGWDALPAVVGIERGFFAEEGLVVSGLALPSAEAIVNSVAAGSTDFAALSQRALLAMAAADLSAKVVAMSGWGSHIALVVPAGEETIASAADLEGRSVAVVRGSDALPVLVRLLNTAKLRPSDVNIRLIQGREVPQVLQEGQADAVFESAHFTATLVDKGRAEIALSHDEIVGQLGVRTAQALVASSTVVDRDPELVQRFVNAWVKAQVYITQDREDAASLLQIFFHRQGVDVPAELARSWVDATRHDRFVWTSADIADAEYNAWALKEVGLLQVQPELDGYIDNRFVEAAKAGLE